MAKTRTRARNYHVQMFDVATGEWRPAKSSPDPRHTWASKARAFSEAAELIHSDETPTPAKIRVLDVRTGQAIGTWTKDIRGQVLKSEPKLLVKS